jgi:hypothetical protein
MHFIKLISLYFLLLSFQGLAVSDPQTEQQSAYRRVPHYELPYNTLWEVLRAAKSSQSTPPYLNLYKSF